MATLRQYGDRLAAGGQLEAALPHYERAVFLQPSAAPARQRLCHALAQLRRTAVCHTGLQPRTSRPHTGLLPTRGLLLTPLSLALDRRRSAAAPRRSRRRQRRQQQAPRSRPRTASPSSTP
eukprot:scaffold111404_cov65-Phaeocystis_antarctica.AAC.1